MALINCIECQKEISDKVLACPHCGYTLENQSKQTSSKSNKKMIIAIICIICLCITGVFIYNNNTEQQYEKLMYTTSYEMLDNVNLMRTIINGVDSIWSASIEYDQDFNLAIARLYDSEAYQQVLSELKTFNIKLENNAKRLQNPPNKFEKVYDEFLELYQTYQGIYGQTKWPSGSLLTYRQDTTEKLTNFLSIWNKIKVLLPDKNNNIKENIKIKDI